MSPRHLVALHARRPLPLRSPRERLVLHAGLSPNQWTETLERICLPQRIVRRTSRTESACEQMISRQQQDVTKHNRTRSGDDGRLVFVASNDRATGRLDLPCVTADKFLEAPWQYP